MFLLMVLVDVKLNVVFVIGMSLLVGIKLLLIGVIVLLLMVNLWFRMLFWLVRLKYVCWVRLIMVGVLVVVINCMFSVLLLVSV